MDESQESGYWVSTKRWNFSKKLNDKKQIYVLTADKIDLGDCLEKATLSARRHILKETDHMERKGIWK